jgi:dTDP-glucose pyrophosphorylase
MKDWLKTLIQPESSIREMILAIGEHHQKIALVVDLEQRLLGTITDGDIRRCMLAGISPDRPVREIMVTEFSFSTPETSREACIHMMREKEIQHLPVLDNDGRIIDLIRIEGVLGYPHSARKNKAVILAGGIGRRLQPLTNKTPKPMLHIGERPILETIIRQLSEHGLLDIYISVNHLADTIKDHFQDGVDFGVNIKYIEEDQPLGTAGPLGLIGDDMEHPLIVMNGDLLTTVDFSSLLMYHQNHQAKATVGVREVDIEIPFGVLDMAQHEVQGITEKPVQQFQVNAGIYVLEPQIVGRISKNTRAEMPEILKKTMDRGERVVGFPIHEYWVDVGQIDDFSRASSEYGEIFSKPAPSNRQ